MSSTPQHQHPMSGVDHFTPKEIAHLVETRGVAKAQAGFAVTLTLSVLAGAFIALGAVLSVVVGTGSSLGYGITKWLAGLAFALGLVLVVIAGAELFTGNNLVLMSAVSRRITIGRLLRNWAVVYLGNLIGALSIVGMVYLAKWWTQGDGSVGATALTTAAAKTSLPFAVVFWRGILCNALVCLAIWIATAGRTVIDKVIAITLPIAAFVAAGFEHSVANMFFIPMGMTIRNVDTVVAASGLSAADLSHLNPGGFLQNLLAATLGNIIGGAVLVGLVYWFVYLRADGPGNSSAATRL